MKKIISLIMMLALVMTVTIIAPLEATFAASKPQVADIEYDYEDREVNIEFYGRVRWKRAKVRIYDNKGRNYARYIIEKDTDDIEIKTKRLKLGKKYKYKITGIKAKGAKKYTTVKGSFYAYND